MKRKIALAVALITLCLSPAAEAGFYFGDGGWGPSWWSPGGWSPAYGPGFAPGWWDGPGWGPGWWGPSPYYSYYNGVQDGVNAGILLGQIDRLIGVKAPTISQNYSMVIAKINVAAQQLAAQQANKMASLLSQQGTVAAVNSVKNSWQQQGMQTQVVTNGSETRLGVAGFSQGLKMLYEIEPKQQSVSVIVGTSQYQIRQSATAQYTPQAIQQ